MNPLISISNVQIQPISPQNGLVAFATCEINNCLYVGSIAIYTAPSHSLGYRCLFPTKKLASGKHVECFYPYRKEAEEFITKAIVNKYVELMDNFNNIENI